MISRLEKGSWPERNIKRPEEDARQGNSSVQLAGEEHISHTPHAETLPSPTDLKLPGIEATTKAPTAAACATGAGQVPVGPNPGSEVSRFPTDALSTAVTGFLKVPELAKVLPAARQLALGDDRGESAKSGFLASPIYKADEQRLLSRQSASQSRTGGIDFLANPQSSPSGTEKALHVDSKGDLEGKANNEASVPKLSPRSHLIMSGSAGATDGVPAQPSSRRPTLAEMEKAKEDYFMKPLSLTEVDMCMEAYILHVANLCHGCGAPPLWLPT
jgi:hypothetical protein